MGAGPRGVAEYVLFACRRTRLSRLVPVRVVPVYVPSSRAQAGATFPYYENGDCFLLVSGLEFLARARTGDADGARSRHCVRVQPCRMRIHARPLCLGRVRSVWTYDAVTGCWSAGALQQLLAFMEQYVATTFWGQRYSWRATDEGATRTNAACCLLQ